MKVPCTIIPGVQPAHVQVHVPFQYPATSSSRLDEIHSQYSYKFHDNTGNRNRNRNRRRNDNKGYLYRIPALSSFTSYFEQNDCFQFLKSSRPTSAAEVLPVASGTLAFTAFLSLSTFLQLKIFRMSTGTLPPIPSLLGIGSVATAALCSHIVSIKSYQFVRQNPNIYSYNHKFGYGYDYPASMVPSKKNLQQTFQMPLDLNFGNKHNVAHALRVCAIGILAYKGLGGRFWSVAPSNLTNLGSFARTVFSLPATKNYANQSQRRAIERLGRNMGCHTCGSRQILSRSKNGVKFIADHMPPQSAVKQMEKRWHRRLLGITIKQRFYPQCISCSGLQGGILSEATRKNMSNLANAGGGKHAFNHGGTFRLEHFAGGIVAAATVWDATDGDILGGWNLDGTRTGSGGNRRRFLEWQINATEVWNSVRANVREFF